MKADIRHQALHGVRWNYTASASILLAQLAYTAVTARILTPRDFGAYAVAQALAALVTQFSLMSVGNAVIRHETVTRAMVGTAFSLSAAAGTGASVATALIAPLWADAWDAPNSVGPVRALGFFVLFTCLASVPLALLRRELRFRTAATVEAGSQIAGMMVGVVLGLLLRSPLALALGQVVGSGLTFAQAAAASRDGLSFRARRGEARALASFASQVSGQSLGYYLLYTAPSLVIARVLGVGQLGFFSRAYILVGLPLNHLTAGLTKALYPMYSRLKSDAALIRGLIEPALIAAIGVVWPAFAAVAGLAPALVAVLLGEGWSTTAQLLPALCVFGAINVAFVIVGNPLEALGHLRAAWFVQICWVMVLGGFLAAWWVGGGDAVALVWLVAAAQAVAHVAQIAVAARLGYVSVWNVGRAYVATAALAAVFYAIAATLERVIALPAAPRLGVELGALSVGVLLAFPLIRRLPAGEAFADFRRGDTLSVPELGTPT